MKKSDLLLFANCLGEEDYPLEIKVGPYSMSDLENQLAVRNALAVLQMSGYPGLVKNFYEEVEK